MNCFVSIVPAFIVSAADAVTVRWAGPLHPAAATLIKSCETTDFKNKTEKAPNSC